MLTKSSTHQGLITGLLAYTIWGFFPLFFHLLRSVASFDVLMHRVIWSFLFVLLIMLILRRHQRLIDAIRTPGILSKLLLSALLVSSNWLVFIWAVSEGRVVESSLGYFITPLISVFLARVFLGERLNHWQQFAIILAVTGLIWLVFKLGYLPWISLALAISFGWYGLVRKQVPVDTLTGLTLETAMMLPVAITYWIVVTTMDKGGFFDQDQQLTFILMLSGVVTALPLLLFASATKKMSLSAIGFMMYINPTLQFISALYILGEPFNTNQFIGFSFIWCALIVFSIGSIKAARVATPAT